MAFMNRIDNARNPLGALVDRMNPQTPGAPAADDGGFKRPQPVPYGPAPVLSPLKTGPVAGALAGAPDPSAGLSNWIRYYGAQAGADPSVLNDTPYWERVIGENMAKNQGNLDKNYWINRMTSDPNKGTGYYADRNAGRIPYDGGMPGSGGAALSGLLGGMTSLPGAQGAGAAVQGAGDPSAKLQQLLQMLMGGR